MTFQDDRQTAIFSLYLENEFGYSQMLLSEGAINSVLTIIFNLQKMYFLK